jgi:trk system potassium uptake protein TrkH
MIRATAIGFVLGQLLVALGISMAAPIAYGWAAGDPPDRSLLVSMAVTIATGAALWRLLPRPARDLSQREGLLMVCATWLATSGFGALPFVLSPHFPTWTDAFFESASGFTTTGATILADVEVLPPALQLWRHFTHWLGGMGIVVLGIAILPLVGHGGMQLYRAEFSGARSEKLKPRIAETAAALWRIYLLFTVLEVIALRAAGLSLFEALCHTFSTLGTGGFSTRTASIAAFDSLLVEAILIVFMLLAGMSFIQHHRLFIERRPRSVVDDVELRAYLAVVVVSTLVIAAVLVAESTAPPGRAVRAALFQVTSIVTTTGFATEDFERWAPLPQLLLLTLMFVGGCTGSTAGGIKVSRVLLLVKVVSREFKRMVEQRGVFAVRLGGRVVPEEAVQSLLSLVYLALMVNFVSVLTLALVGIDVLTSISAITAAMFNIGPGLGSVGPAENYGHLPALAKWTLAFCMIAGRLEFYTVIVILTPHFWRR